KELQGELGGQDDYSFFNFSFIGKVVLSKACCQQGIVFSGYARSPVFCVVFPVFNPATKAPIKRSYCRHILLESMKKQVIEAAMRPGLLVAMSCAYRTGIRAHLIPLKKRKNPWANLQIGRV